MSIRSDEQNGRFAFKNTRKTWRLPMAAIRLGYGSRQVGVWQPSGWGMTAIRLGYGTNHQPKHYKVGVFFEPILISMEVLHGARPFFHGRKQTKTGPSNLGKTIRQCSWQFFVTFLGWWKRDPFKGWIRDLQRSGIKRSRLESPGLWSYFCWPLQKFTGEIR